MITITFETVRGVSVVIPNGRIDSITSSDLDHALLPLFEKENYLIIDFSQCTFLSSAGIRTLLISAKKLLASGGGLLLCELLPEIFQVLEMAGMLKVFRLHKSREDAIIEIERLRLITNGSYDWQTELCSFHFTPFESTRETALLWRDDGIAGYNELAFSIGTGIPAESPDEATIAQGIFITDGHCAGFIPDNPQFPSDFRIPLEPADAGIFVNRAISFGEAPLGMLRLSEPSTITLARLSEALYPIKQQFLSGETDLMAMVVANLDAERPSVSIFALVDNGLTTLLNQSQFIETESLQSVNDQIRGLWGARFILGNIPVDSASLSLSNFLKKVLTFENIVNVEVIHNDDRLVNPVTWIFISAGIGTASAKRLQLETGDDFIPEPHKAFLARRLYADSGRLVINQIHGGYSAQTFQVTSFDHKGRKLRPTVLKIADRAMIFRESDRCKRYANPYILNNSAMVLGTEFFGNTGALRYNFVGIGGEQTRLKWLTHYFHHWPTEQLEPLFDKIFLQILHPWYGQPIQEVIHPFRDHDPRSTFFPQLCETASDQLSVSPDEKFFKVKETGQELVNPYWFLKHEFARRSETEINYYTSICHGDLNMQNILLDEDMNVYLIDFSETKPRSVISDFARLEAIFMVDNAPLHDEKGTEAYLKFICSFYGTIRLDQKPVATYVGDHSEQVSKNVALTIKMREYAFRSVNNCTDTVPYCIALLEWIMPVVCYSSASDGHKRLSMIVSALLCENLLSHDQSCSDKRQIFG